MNKTDLPEETRLKFEEFATEFQAFTLNSLFERAIKGFQIITQVMAKHFNTFY